MDHPWDNFAPETTNLSLKLKAIQGELTRLQCRLEWIENRLSEILLAKAKSRDGGASRKEP